jgi:23S rRNA (pseudouridine1915-N3)-methyltransferase
MQIEFWTIGKSESGFIEDGVKAYLNKVGYFQKVMIQEFKNNLKGKLDSDFIKKNEKDLIQSKLSKEDFLVLLDEKGQHFNSLKFAEWLENHIQLHSTKKLIFLVGGAYGFHEDIYTRANFKISLSALTFSHQLIRLIFLEQLFRAYTIINRHPYHNE